MPRIYLNVEVNAESILDKIARMRDHLNAAEELLREIRLLDSDVFKSTEAAAPESESDAAAKSKSRLSGITIDLHGNGDQSQLE